MSLSAETLEPRLLNGKIRVVVPELHFVSGKALERLHNAAPVPYAIQLSLSTDRWMSVAQRDIERFVVSYDLWEERFAIVKLGSPRKAVSHLNARGVEAWCLDEMLVPPAAAPPEQPFWLRVEVRAENPGDSDGSLLTDEGVSLTRLIEMFSRRTRSEQARWVVDAGPFRLANLMRGAHAGGAR